MTRRRLLDLVTHKIEGCVFVVTDYGTVNVTDKTWAAQVERYTERYPKTAERRAMDAVEAIAMWAAEREWKRGKQLREI